MPAQKIGRFTKTILRERFIETVLRERLLQKQLLFKQTGFGLGERQGHVGLELRVIAVRTCRIREA